MATLNLHTAANLAYLIPEWWDTKVRTDAARKAFWDKFEGKEGSNQPIITRTDFTKKAGDTVHIQVISELLNEGVTAESTLQGSEGKLSLGQFDLTANWLRNAVAFNKKSTKEAFFNAIMTANNRLSSWLARRKDADMFEQILDNTTHTIYANDASTSATLGSNDTFGTTEIDRIRLALIRKGAIPIRTIADGKAEQPIYGIVISELDAYNLQADTVWVQSQQNAGVRGEKNPLFTMAMGMYHGCLVYVHHGIGGFQGTPLRPETSLYQDHLLGEVTTITVGADANKNHTKFFPDDGTIKIVRASDGEEEYVSYSSKTANTFVITARGATYGGVTPNAALNLVTGDLVTNLNHQSKQVGFGAEVAARVWGKYPAAIRQELDYGFEYGVGIECVYGQKVIENSDADKPNYLIMESYAKNPSASI